MLLRKALYMKRVMRNQWMSSQELNSYKLRGLKELVEYSTRFVPFYQKLYGKLGVGHQKLKVITDIGRLPIITRKQFLDAGMEVFSKDMKFVKGENLRQRSTSGSTGGNFRIKYDERAWDYLEAIYARSFFNQGYNPVHKMAYYWYEPLQRKFHNLFGLFRRHLISCYWPIEKQIDELKSHNFEYIHYFSSIIYYISRIISDADARRIRPMVIFTHAEILSEKMKERIEKTFKCEVYDMYGTTEFIRMAWECPICGVYHVDEDSLILEVLDNQNNPCPPGKQGRFVVTGLANYLLPLIRYEMGDYGQISMKENKCGRDLISIDGISGRKDDFLISCSGKPVPPKLVIDTLDPVDELGIFEVVQLADSRYLVNAKPKPNNHLPELKVRQVLKGILGRNARIEVKNSPPGFSKRGKLRLVKNLAVNK